MFTKSVMAVTLAGFVAALSAPAFANPGTDQLAKQLGVDPGAYTLNQLVQLQDAYNDNDTSRIAFILGSANGVSSRASTALPGAPNAGETQLALSLGVTPGSLSADDLVKLGNAIADNDANAIAFILGGSQGGNADNDIGVVTPAKVQIAGVLNVDPAAYTTLKLVQMVNDL